MAGNVPGFSLTPQFDKSGALAPGAKLYIIQAGTVSTPQNAYQDTGLTILAPNPLVADATGRFAQWFVADGQIKLRLTDKNGVELFVQDNLLVIGPSGGGGGGGSVDPTTILSTGDMKLVYGSGVLAGFVRANARTIGSATSGATERANADTSALFSFLWNADPNLTVSGGRGASAAADFAANKTIALPDFRGRTIAGLADMGNTASTILNGVTFNGAGSSIILGSNGGAATRTLTANQMPTHRHSVFTTDSGHTHGGVITSSLGYTSPGGATNVVQALVGGSTANAFSGVGITSGDSVPNATLQAGLGQAFESISPVILVTTYIKL